MEEEFKKFKSVFKNLGKIFLKTNVYIAMMILSAVRNN